MRKVNPQTDIPITELTPEAQNERVQQFRETTRSLLTQAKAYELESKLSSGAIDGYSDTQILDMLTQVSDQILSETSKFTVCMKGCGECCKLPVHVTVTEAKKIAEFTGKKAQKLITHQLITDQKLQNNYCPFFDTNVAQCSIYEVRPLVCRLYSSLDHYDNCGGTETHYHTSLNVTKPINQGYNFLNHRLLKREKKGKGAYAADIRFWFQ